MRVEESWTNIFYLFLDLSMHFVKSMIFFVIIYRSKVFEKENFKKGLSTTILSSSSVADKNHLHESKRLSIYSVEKIGRRGDYSSRRKVALFLLFHRFAEGITLTRYLEIVRSRQSERIMRLHSMKGQLPVSGAPFGSCHLSCSEIEPKFQRALQVASQAVSRETPP